METDTRRRFAGKRVLVTGAAGGVGAAVATQFAAEGAAVLRTDITAAETANETANAPTTSRTSPGTAMTAAGGTVEVADLADPAELTRIAELAVNRLGGLDVLCNVAGVQRFCRADQLTAGVLQQHLSVNAVAPLLLTHALLPALTESGGNVVTVASISAVMGQPYNTAYCASKAALLLGMRSLAVELAGRGIRVNCVSPGAIDTELITRAAQAMPADVDWALISRSLGVLPGFATPDQVGSALLYLASDDAASITGSNLVIDRGTIW